MYIVYIMSLTLCIHCTSIFNLDIDECENRQDNCAENAKCINEPGMFGCVCTEGHFGNGYICIGITISITGKNNSIIKTSLDNDNMIPDGACDEPGRCMCFNESSEVQVKCGCLPGYKSETEGDISVCSGMLILKFIIIYI
jgi:hypothetical protein